MPTIASRDEPVEVPSWWGDVEYIVTVLPGVHGRDAADRLIEYSVGEEYPAETDILDPEAITGERWATSPWLATKCAALDAEFSRLDRPSGAERLSDDSSHGSGAIETFRRGRGVRTVTITEREYVCDDCGATFDSQDRLNGHKGKHAREEREAAEDGSDTGAEADGDAEPRGDADRADAPPRADGEAS